MCNGTSPDRTLKYMPKKKRIKLLYVSMVFENGELKLKEIICPVCKKHYDINIKDRSLLCDHLKYIAQDTKKKETTEGSMSVRPSK